jgi:nucleotide-binding universal stress UspA family protein
MDAEYTLVRAVELSLFPDGFRGAEEPSAIEQPRLAKRRAEAQAYLDTVAERLRAKALPIQTHVTVGESTAAAVLDVVGSQNIDLVAISTHGRSGFKRWLLGSVADKIVRGTFAPVLVYRPVTTG